MAATGPYGGLYNGGGAGGRNVDAHARSQSAQVYSTAESLRAKARESVTLQPWHTIDIILEEASKSNVHVNTGLGFEKPEQAYLEWMKCEEYIRLLVQNPNFHNASEEKRRKIISVQRAHEGQREKIKEIEAAMKSGASGPALASGLYSAYNTSQAAGRSSVYGNGTAAATSHISMQASNRHTINGTTTTTTTPGVGLTVDTSRKPTQSNGQGWSTDLRGIPTPLKTRTQDDPLLARFSQLRSPTSNTLVNGQTKAAVPDSLRPVRPSTPTGANGTDGADGNAARPAGPRLMPRKEVNKKLPSTPPHLSTQELLDSLPRAPSPIYSPATTTQNPTATPPRTSSMAFTNGRPPQAKEKKVFPEFRDPNVISPENLFDLMKSFKLLIIDVRSREQFDEGHVHAKNIICIEPITLKPGQSLNQLEETLLYAPDDEVAMFKRVADFDLVVFYDQDTADSNFLRGPPAMHRSRYLRYLYDSLTEFNYGQALQRSPAYLVGGIDAWVDLVSVNALQSSSTAPTSKTAPPVPQRRRTTRASIIGENSSREIRANRMATHKTLDPDEAQQWLQKVKNEEQAPADIRQFVKHTDGDSVSSQSEDELFLPIQSMDDFFRKYPEPNQVRQSMTSPAPSSASNTSSYTSSRPQPLSLPQYVPPAAPPPPMPIPSRPPPAASRPSYSGVSDRRPAQGTDPQARANKSRPPIYQSRSLAQTIKLPRTGMKNFGVTCYMNSTIQCLNATLPLSRFFLDETWRKFLRKNWKGSNGIMPEIFAALIRGLWKNESASVRPTSFRNFCTRMNDEWGKERQQDSKEFLEWLIDVLHEDFNDNFSRNPLRSLTEAEEAHREELGKRQMNRVSKREWDRYTHREHSYISNLFAGQHASQLRCTTCQRTSTTYEAFYSISVEIPRTGVGDIRACLQSYCREEQLSGNEEWRCPNCKCTRVATKRILITRLPQILVVHFKRFSAGWNETARKVHTPIEFPLHGLDMQPYMANTYIEPGPDDYADPAITPPFLYDCYAVMRHLGQSGNAGHYVAMCRDAARACWREYNDDSITDFDPGKLRPNDRLQNQQAYIVFYERAAPR